MPQDDDLSRILGDPDFRKLGYNEKVKVLDVVAPDFAPLSPQVKAELIQMHMQPSTFEKPGLGQTALEFGGGVRAAGLKNAYNVRDLVGGAFGAKPISQRPDIKAETTPAPGAGQAGYEATNLALGLLPIPGMQEIALAKDAPLFLRLGVAAAREAADVGLRTAAQTGSLKEAGKQAAIGGGIGAAGPVVSEAAPALRRGAERSYAQVLAPGSKADKFVTANKLLTPMGGDLLERRVAALTESGLKEKVARKLAQSTDKLEKAWTALGPQRAHNLQPVLDELQQDAIRNATEAVPRGVQFSTPGLPGRRIVNPELYAAYQDAAFDLVERLGPKTDMASAFSMRKVRQLLDRAVKDSFAGKELTGVQKEAKRATTDAIRAVLNQENPTIGEINREYSFWRTADDVFENTNLRRVGQKRALRKVMQGGIGAAAGAVGLHAGGIREGAEALALGTWLGGKLEDAMTSTAWKTVSAVTKNEIARLMVDGKVEQAANLAARAAGQLNINREELRKQLPPSAAASPASPAAPPANVPPPPKGGEKVLGHWSPQNRQLLAEASATSGVPLPALYAVAANENAAGDPTVQAGPKGGIGLMQVVRSTGAQFGAKDLTDPRQNVAASARYLRHLMDTFKQPELVLAAYRAGENAVKNAGNRVENMDRDVQQYVQRGMRTWAGLTNPEQAKAAGF